MYTVTILRNHFNRVNARIHRKDGSHVDTQFFVNTGPLKAECQRLINNAHKMVGLPIIGLNQIKFNEKDLERLPARD